MSIKISNGLLEDVLTFAYNTAIIIFAKIDDGRVVSADAHAQKIIDLTDALLRRTQVFNAMHDSDDRFVSEERFRALVELIKDKFESSATDLAELQEILHFKEVFNTADNNGCYSKSVARLQAKLWEISV